MDEQHQLKKDLDAWVTKESKEDNSIPDLWYECNTSERLAEYLISIGWKLGD